MSCMPNAEFARIEGQQPKHAPLHNSGLKSGSDLGEKLLWKTLKGATPVVWMFGRWCGHALPSGNLPFATLFHRLLVIGKDPA